MDISPDELQNEVILIKHHVEDALKGLKEKDYSYVEKGILDIQESVERLEKKLPAREQDGVKSITSAAKELLSIAKSISK